MGEAEEGKDLSKAKGGHARADKLPPERRKEIAARAALARWRGAPIKATHAGVVRIGDVELDCANLPDGRRVISEAAIMRALGRGYSGYYSQRDASTDGSAVLPRYVAPLALKPFIPEDLLSLLSNPIAYLPPGGSNMSKGVEAQALPKICRVWIEARNAGKLTTVQQRAATKAEMLSFGFAEVGIAALIDEATGYQEVRDRRALEAILDRFLQKELAAWAKRFPDEFYQQIFRLKGWEWNGMSVKRPGVVGRYTTDLVYERLAPGILAELERRNPKNEHGHRPNRHHQWLTEDIGHPALAQHLYALIGFMRVASDWDQFYRMVQRAFPKKNTTMLLPAMD
jgi:hypothetical protein